MKKDINELHKIIHFIPEFAKLTLPSLNMVRTISLQIGVSFKNQNRMTSSVNPDETAHHEPSHQDLHCLQKPNGLRG